MTLLRGIKLLPVDSASPREGAEGGYTGSEETGRCSSFILVQAK